MYSMAVGMYFDLMMTGTVSIAVARSPNGINRLIAFFGKGNSLRMALVTKPKVPSEPTIRSFTL